MVQPSQKAAASKLKVMKSTAPKITVDGHIEQDEPGEDWLSRTERHIRQLRSKGFESQALEAEQLRDKKLRKER